MTHHLVDARAAALRETLIIQRRRNAPMLRREVIHQLVNLQRRHTLTDLLLHQVQHCRIQHTRLADALNLFRRLNQFTLWHQTALILEIQNSPVHLRQRLSALHMPISRIFLLQQSHIFIRITLQSYDFIPKQTPY